MPRLPASADDFKQFQELFKRVAQSQDIPLEEVKTNQHKLVQILQPSSTSKISLPINEVILVPAKTIWHTPASIKITCKRGDRKYYVPSKGEGFLFAHPPRNSLVVKAVNNHNKQPQFRFMPQDKEHKRLNLFRCKVYSSVTLQFRMTNYSALLDK